MCGNHRPHWAEVHQASPLEPSATARRLVSATKRASLQATAVAAMRCSAGPGGQTTCLNALQSADGRGPSYLRPACQYGVQPVAMNPTFRPDPAPAQTEPVAETSAYRPRRSSRWSGPIITCLARPPVRQRLVRTSGGLHKVKKRGLSVLRATNGLRAWVRPTLCQRPAPPPERRGCGCPLWSSLDPARTSQLKRNV